MTEVPISLLQLHTYVGSSSRLAGLSWGAEDLAGVIGAHANREADGRWTSPYQLARNLCLFTAAAAATEPIDTVFINFRDAEGLRAEANEAVRDGFTGKMAIHPNQVAVINEVFTPSPEQVAVSEEIVQLFADNPNAGALGLRGQMVDRPHLTRAERILRACDPAAGGRCDRRRRLARRGLERLVRSGYRLLHPTFDCLGGGGTVARCSSDCSRTMVVSRNREL